MKLAKFPIVNPSIRSEFPILNREIHGNRITYLDSASTSLKPRCVLEGIREYYEECTANVHRSTHPYGEMVTQWYEEARNTVAQFINARPDEIVFVRNTTEGINLVAAGMGLRPNDEVITTSLEHHSNQLPWLSRCKVNYLPLDSFGLPSYELIEHLVNKHTRLIALGAISNVTGTRANLEEPKRTATKYGIPLLLDGAQAIGHMPIDVENLNCDYFAFSAHKICGPSGIGILWGRRKRLQNLKPSLYGGGMVQQSHFDTFQLKEIPFCFEAGTPNIEGAIGLAKAIGFLQKIGMAKVERHSLDLGQALVEGLGNQKHVRLIADKVQGRYGIATFFVDSPGLSAEALGRILADSFGVFISSGMHCTHPYHLQNQLPTTLRASTHIYTTHKDIAVFLDALKSIL